MKTETIDVTPEAQIRAQLDDWARTTRAKDIDGIVSLYAPDILAFDCHPQPQFKGVDALKQHLEACLPCMQGPMVFEIHGLKTTARDDVAFCHSLAFT